MNREVLKFLLLVVIVLLCPLAVHEGYILNVLVFVGIHSMLAVALNLLLGYAGQISLGHAGFFGLGAYLSGILTATYAINPWLAMVVAALSVTALAFVIGFPVLKLKGHYLAMATLGMGIIIYIVFNEAVDHTGGPSGLSGIPNLSLAGLTFDSDLKNYYLIWTWTLVSIGLALNLVHHESAGRCAPSTTPRWPPGSWGSMPACSRCRFSPSRPASPP
jgi:branched-chain amino acid transport system permease protein